MSSHETEQLVASIFRQAKAAAKRDRAGPNGDAEKIRNGLRQRMEQEREEAQFWAAVDRAHELAMQAVGEAERVIEGWE